MHVAIDAVGIRDFGGAVILDNFVRQLPAQRPDWLWTVFVLPEAQREFSTHGWPPAVRVVTIDGASGAYQRLRWINQRLPPKLREQGCDVLFSLANVPPFRAQRPCVLYIHMAVALDPSTLPPGAWLSRWYYQAMRVVLVRSLPACARIVVQTEAMRSLIGVAAPAMVPRVEVIPPGFDAALLDLPVGRAVSNLAAARTSPRLVYPGQVQSWKNHETLIRALPQIRARFPTASLTLTIPTRTVAERDGHPAMALYRLAESIGALPAIVPTGTLPRRDVLELLRTSDLMVFPSATESFGLPLVEALFADCPVAAADLHYAHNVLGDAAAYFPHRNPAECAATVCRVLSDPTEQLLLRERGRLQRKRFAAAAVAELLVRTLEAAAGDAITRQDRHAA